MIASSLFAPRRNAANGAAAYRAAAVEIQVAGADSHRLVALLFEAFESAVAEAQGACRANDTDRKCRAITQAIRIVNDGLRAGLDLKAGGALARDLQELYGYLTMRLTVANLRNDLQALDECQRLMRPLREAWAAIAP